MKSLFETPPKLACIALMIAIACFSGCARSGPSSAVAGTTPPTTASELPKVSTVHPTRKAIAQKSEQPGRIDAFLMAPLHTHASGYVHKVLVDIGDHVSGPKSDDKGQELTPGQVLVVISAPEVDEQLRQAEANVQKVQADVRQADAAVLVARAASESAKALVDEAEAETLKAEADLKRWKSEFDRVTELAASKTVTGKLADEAEQQYRAAVAGQAAVAAKVRSVMAKASEAEVGIKKSEADAEAVKARLTVAEAEVRQAQAMVDYLTLRAPFDGIITQRSVDPGRLVQPAKSPQETPLLTIVQADTLRLFVDIPEADAVLVEPGRKATIRVPSLPGQALEGTVTRTAWSLDAGNRTLRTEFDLSNPDGKLRPGMFAQVELTVAERAEAVVVPKGAVITVDGQTVCLAVGSDGTVQSRPVKTGLRTATEVEVVSGVTPDDKVISANAAAFKPGQKVATSQPSKP